MMLSLGACSTSPTERSSCRAIAQATPLFNVIPVGARTTITATLEAGCPAPRVRNDTPAVLEVNSFSATEFRVIGRTVGEGRLRVLSGVDTLVSVTLSVTVTPVPSVAPAAAHDR